MTDIDAFVQLVEEAQRSSVEVGDDLDHHPPNGRRVDGFEGIRAPAKVENTELAEQQNQALLSVVGHFLESVVDVRSFLENGESRVVDVPSLFLVGGVGFCDAL